MKKLSQRLKLMLVIIIAISLSACGGSKNDKTDKVNVDTTAKVSTETPPVVQEVKRPDKTEKSLESKVWKFDSRWADISKAIRTVRESIDKGGKMTTVQEKNISDMIKEARTMEAAIEPMVDQLAKREFDMFCSRKSDLNNSEVKFEALKQEK